MKVEYMAELYGDYRPKTPYKLARVHLLNLIPCCDEAEASAWDMWKRRLLRLTIEEGEPRLAFHFLEYGYDSDEHLYRPFSFCPFCGSAIEFVCMGKEINRKKTRLIEGEKDEVVKVKYAKEIEVYELCPVGEEVKGE